MPRLTPLQHDAPPQETLGQSLSSARDVSSKHAAELKEASTRRATELKEASTRRATELASATAQSIDSAKNASARGVDNLKGVGVKGVDGIKSAAGSGADKIRSATAAAKGARDEALSAAAAVSGLSLQRDKEPESLCCRCCPRLSFKQRVIGAFGCLVLGTLLSLFSLGSLAKLFLGNPGEKGRGVDCE